MVQKLREARKAVVAVLAGLTVLVTEGFITGTVAHDIGIAVALAAAFGVYVAKNTPPAQPSAPPAG